MTAMSLPLSRDLTLRGPIQALAAVFLKHNLHHLLFFDTLCKTLVSYHFISWRLSLLEILD